MIDRVLEDPRPRLADRPGTRRVVLAEVIEQVARDGATDARAGGFGFAVSTVDPGLVVDADPEILAFAIDEIVGNALRHSRNHGHIALSTTATIGRALVEVQDECGGLAPEDIDVMFRPLAGNRLHAQLGLCTIRAGVRRMRGEIWVSNVPGQGCVFTVDLPRRIDG